MKVKIDEPQPPTPRSIRSCCVYEWWQGCDPKNHFIYCRTSTGVLFYDKVTCVWGVLREDENRQVSHCICKSLELEWD